MYRQLRDYDDFRGLDLYNAMELSVISQGIFTDPQKPSWVTLKRHLLNAQIPKKLFKALRENPMNDKDDEFNQERLFRRVSQIPIRQVSGGAFCVIWRTGDSPSPFTRYFSRYSMITLPELRKRRNKRTVH